MKKVRPKVGILCAGKIGLAAVRVLVDFHNRNEILLSGIITHQIEAPQDDLHREIIFYAKKHSIPCFEQKKIENWPSGFSADYILTVKWRYLINDHLIKTLNGAMIVFHASLLPMGRGFAPIQWPILLGEHKSGVSMFLAADEVDSGEIIAQQTFPVDPNDRASDVDAKVERCLLKLLKENLIDFLSGLKKAIPQIHENATYRPWLDSSDGRINWNLNALEIKRKVNAFSYPYSGAYCFLNNEKLVVEEVEIEDYHRHYPITAPGKVESFTNQGCVRVHTHDRILTIRKLRSTNGEYICPTDKIKRLKTRLT